MFFFLSVTNLNGGLNYSSETGIRNAENHFLPVSLVTPASHGSSGGRPAPGQASSPAWDPSLLARPEHPCYEPILCAGLLSWIESPWVFGPFSGEKKIHMYIPCFSEKDPPTHIYFKEVMPKQGSQNCGMIQMFAWQINTFNTKIAVIYVMRRYLHEL